MANAASISAIPLKYQIRNFISGLLVPNLLLYVDKEFASPYAMAAFVALQEKKLSFDIATLDLAANANHAPAYASTSLTRRVPTLVHDGFALSESSAICEYIDEVFPGTALYPRGSQDRARARQVQAWIRSDLLPIRSERSTEVVFYGVKKPPLSTEAQAAVAKLVSAVELLLPEGADNLFDAWCIADVDLAVMLNRLVMNGDAVPERLAAYAHRQWQRPSVQQWVNRERPLLS
jgi:glutathione S-transferase